VAVRGSMPLLRAQYIRLYFNEQLVWTRVRSKRSSLNWVNSGKPKLKIIIMKKLNGEFICHDPCYSCNHRTVLGYTCSLNGIPYWVLSTDKSSSTCNEYIKRNNDLKHGNPEPSL
jgi:hypothetical protein